MERKSLTRTDLDWRNADGLKITGKSEELESSDEKQQSYIYNILKYPEDFF
jgi:hypothetical protein